MRMKNKKKRCSIEGCEKVAIEVYEDEDIKFYFCKQHKPYKINKKIKGGNITYTKNDILNN